MGNHPPGFAEWNDKYRDGVRRFWRGDFGMRPDLAARLTGSAELFKRRFRKPWASVNFVASHDGFTLADVTAYSQKHNEDNRKATTTGTTRIAVQTGAWKARAMMPRFSTSVRASPGTPMLLGGDEFGRNQRGNNNAYCQDNEISWYDCEAAQSPQGLVMAEFIARVVALRKNTRFCAKRASFTAIAKCFRVSTM